MSRKLISALALAVAALQPTTLFAAFSDVTEIYPYADSITFLEEKGVIEGYPDGTFRPNVAINRAEFLAIIRRAQEQYKQDTNTGELTLPECLLEEDAFSDVQQDDWFALYVCEALDEQIVEGYPDGTFRPEQLVNFVEAAKIIDIAFGTPSTELTDVWYEPYILDLGERNAIPLSITSLEAPLTRGEMAEMIWRLWVPNTDLPSHTLEDFTTTFVDASDTVSYQLECGDLVDSDADTEVVFRDDERGVEFRIPYNFAWGYESEKVRPFVWHGEDQGISFGYPVAQPQCSWIRAYSLVFSGPLSASGAMMRSQDELLVSPETTLLQNVTRIANNSALETTYSSAECTWHSIEVLGSQANYIFSTLCGGSLQELRSILATVTLVESATQGEWQTYTNNEYDYTLSVPSTATAEAVSEGRWERFPEACTIIRYQEGYIAIAHRDLDEPCGTPTGVAAPAVQAQEQVEFGDIVFTADGWKNDIEQYNTQAQELGISTLDPETFDEWTYEFFHFESGNSLSIAYGISAERELPATYYANLKEVLYRIIDSYEEF